MRPRLALLAIVALSLLLVVARSPAVSLAQAPGTGFIPSACPFPLPEGQIAGKTVRCGYVRVPEDRTVPSGSQILLAVAVFQSQSANPDPVPTIYLEGGPGGPALEGGVASRLGKPDVASALLADRDLIIFDQRGTGFSRPVLDCPEVTQLGINIPDEQMPNEEGIEPEPTPDELQMQVDAFTRCRDRLVGQGVNLAVYNSVSNAADVRDVVLALGYPTVNLWGISYGTRLAQAVMRYYPQIVRSTVIDGVVPNNAFFQSDAPMNAVRAFDLLFSGCAADAGCNAAYPDLENRFYRLVRELNDQPVQVTLTNPTSGATRMERVTGKLLVATLFQSLYARALIPELPRVIALASEGEYGVLTRLLSIFTFSAERFSIAQQVAINCADMAGLGTPESLAVAAASVRPEIEAGISETSYFPTCAVLNVPPATPEQQQPLQSDIPTLVTSGQFDPVTPPSYGAQVAQTLPNSFVIEYRGGGHGAGLDGLCQLGIMAAFLKNPTTKPDTTCAAALGAPKWRLPEGR